MDKHNGRMDRADGSINDGWTKKGAMDDQKMDGRGLGLDWTLPRQNFAEAAGANKTEEGREGRRWGGWQAEED